MKVTALFSALALGALTSAAVAEPVVMTTPAEPVVTATAPVTTVPGQVGRLELNDRQLDGLKAGQPSHPTGFDRGFICSQSGNRARPGGTTC